MILCVNMPVEHGNASYAQNNKEDLLPELEKFKWTCFGEPPAAKKTRVPRKVPYNHIAFWGR